MPPSTGLQHFFSPKSVAVIGATEKPHHVGRAVLWNLIGSPFGGTVFPVNPRHSNVLGIKAYPTVAAVPDPVDLAVIITPAETVPPLIRECADAGVRGAIIISAGFREAGPHGAELEAQALAEARRGNVRLIGPNCLGVMCPVSGFNATFAPAIARVGNVALISQSGAILTAILDWSAREQVGFSALISAGSMADVGWGDLIDYLGDDPNTRSIVIYMESIGNARSFLSAAREVALSKPIIVIKAGRTEAAARAAASHTGSLVGSDDVLEAAFRRVGVLRVNSISDIFYITEVLGRQPHPAGPRLTIVTNAGGPAVLAADTLLVQGGQLATLAPETVEALNECLPAHWSHNNPIDIIGDAGPDRYAKALEIAVKDPASDGLLVIMAPQGLTDPAAVAEQVRAFAHLQNKPILASWMGGFEAGRGEAVLNAAGIPTFPFPDTAARTFLYMWRYSYNLRALYETPTQTEGVDTAQCVRACEMLARLRESGRTLLTGHETKELLMLYGIPVPDVTAEPMVADQGYELIIRSSIDPQIGPVVLFGAGGVLVEAYQDHALGLPPLNTTLARRMLEQTKIFNVLKSKLTPAILASLEQILVRFSHLVTDHPSIREVEMSPVRATREGLIALDARAVLYAHDSDPASWPVPAIRPYPAKYVKSDQANDITYRPIRPEDEPLLVAFHNTLSQQSVYLRYFHWMKLERRTDHDRLIRMCFIDYDRQMAIVAVRGTAVVGVGRLVRSHTANEAELAAIVSDGLQGRGIGTELVRLLVEFGRDEKIGRLTAIMLSENRAMRRVFEKFGFAFTRGDDYQTVAAELKL